jgi:hypothetical protein
VKKMQKNSRASIDMSCVNVFTAQDFGAVRLRGWIFFSGETQRGDIAG